MEQELTPKDKLLKMIIQSKKKRKVKKIAEPKLKVEGIPSTVFPDSEIMNKNKTRYETEELRDKIRNIADFH